MRRVTLFAMSILALSAPAFAEIIDPVSFCAGPQAPNTICSGDPNIIGGTSFTMIKNGNSDASTDPWYLLVAVPEDLGGAPTITSDGGVFTQVGSTADKGAFLPTTSGDIYSFAGLTGQNSMNATNMFGSEEQAAFGGTPAFFEIYVYTFSPSFIGNFVNYSFTVGGSGLVNGTFLAAEGGKNEFSTPFTTTGLVNTPDGGMTLVLLGGALVGLGSLRRKFHV